MATVGPIWMPDGKPSPRNMTITGHNAIFPKSPSRALEPICAVTLTGHKLQSPYNQINTGLKSLVLKILTLIQIISNGSTVLI